MRHLGNSQIIYEISYLHRTLRTLLFYQTQRPLPFQVSVVNPLLFLAYINNLSNCLYSNVKFIADNTSFFSVFYDLTASVNTINKDLLIMRDQTSQWKMSSKQTKKVISSRKTSIIEHISITFNGNYIQKATLQKYLGMLLNSKLNFKEHISQKINKPKK